MLRATSSKQAKRTVVASRSDPSGSTNYQFLSKSKLKDRLRAIHTLQCNTHKKLERLKEKFVESREKNGVDVDEETHDDLLNVMEKCSKEGLVKHFRYMADGASPNQIFF